MASKKKAKEVIKKKRAGNDAACEDRAAPKQMRAVKAKKAASASVGGKDEAKRNLERTPKERTPKKIAKVRGSVAARAAADAR